MFNIFRAFKEWYTVNALRIQAKDLMGKGLDCDEVVGELLPMLERMGLKIGKDFVVVHSEVYDPHQRKWLRHVRLELFKKYKLGTNLYWREMVLWKAEYKEGRYADS